MKEKLIHVRTSEKLYNQLTELSAKHNTNFSNTVREALEYYVKNKNNKYAEFESYLTQGDN